jgi:hypothetical protein
LGIIPAANPGLSPQKEDEQEQEIHPFIRLSQPHDAGAVDQASPVPAQDLA